MARPAQGDLGQEAIDICRGDVRHLTRAPFRQHQPVQHADLILGIGGRQLWQVLIDEAVDQILDDGRVASVGAVIHRIFATIDVALEAFGFLAGGNDRPVGPRADRHAPLAPRGAVDQDEPLAPRQEHAQAEARAIFVEHNVLARADFGRLYNSFCQMCGHIGSPFRTD